MPDSSPSRGRAWVSLVVALWLLDASVTFRNLWPTPAVWWGGGLSIELGVALTLLVLATSQGARVPARWLGVLTGTWLLLLAGRYADVTTPALLGRPINVFWDVRYARDVAAMFVTAAPAWAVALAGAGVLAACYGGFRLLRWAWSRVARAAARGGAERRVVGATGLGLLVLFPVLSWTAAAGLPSPFAKPVTQTYAQQVRLIRDALGAAARQLPDTPPLDADFSLVGDADLLLMFMESYGAVTWQRPDFVGRLAAPRAALASAIDDTGRALVSGYVESPTYGGSSWFAHISLLSGIEVRDPNANALLMTQQRETLVTAAARRGFRTVALMPGLWQAWPEGSFYGFQEIYGGERLDYRGPQFGWWALPDQFTLARFDALELERQPRRPIFVFFPTVSTHTPFTPTPPYQGDWVRMLSDQPFDEAAVIEAFDRQPDWTNLSPSYGDAVAYAYDVLAGYLRKHRGRDLVLIVLGDHQPPALVSGEGQPWDVPVHVITSRTGVRRDILERLKVVGFRDGLDPGRERITKMHQLLPLLLDALGDREPQAGRLARR